MTRFLTQSTTRGAYHNGVKREAMTTISNYEIVFEAYHNGVKREAMTSPGSGLYQSLAYHNGVKREAMTKYRSV